MRGTPDPPADVAGPGTAAEVFREALWLGLTAFGGPVAHLGHFERRYVGRLRWLSTAEYGGLVALCQALPGPTSSQVGFLVGVRRAGWSGGLASWAGFTLPSALAMFGCARLAPRMQGPLAAAMLHGLKLAAVAVVAQAAWRMARALCPDRTRAAIALAAAAPVLVAGGTGSQVLALGIGAAGGAALCRGLPARLPLPVLPGVGARTGGVALACFLLLGLGLLPGLPVADAAAPHALPALASIFYAAGALVFGGGHVVLPLLRDALVPSGWLPDGAFLAGYGAAQAMPGPLFAVSAYLGAVAAPPGLAAPWSAVALVAMFLPGLLLALAGLPLWGWLGRHPTAGAGLAGVNAAVVGLLGAALYDPVWTGAVTTGGDAALAVAGLLLLERGRVPPPVAVGFCVAASVLSALR